MPAIPAHGKFALSQRTGEFAGTLHSLSLYDIKNHEANILKKIGIFVFVIFGLFLLSWQISKTQKQSGKTILLGYSDGPISGAEIRFKENGNFAYISSTLFGEKEFEGIYTIINDTIFIRYDKEKPRITSEKLIIFNKRLIFLNHDNSTQYKFYIESEYLTNIDKLLNR